MTCNFGVSTKLLHKVDWWRPANLVQRTCSHYSQAFFHLQGSSQSRNLCRISNMAEARWKSTANCRNRTVNFSHRVQFARPLIRPSSHGMLFHTNVARAAERAKKSEEEEVKNTEEWETLMDNEDKKQNIGSIPFKRQNVFTIPNLLSLCRIVAAPFIGNMILNGEYVLASSLMLAAAATDMLDGQIARRWPSQKSAFGSALDPLADKILVTVLTVTLSTAGMLPIPLAVVIIGRDVSLVAAVFYLRYRTCPPPVTLKRYFDMTLVNTQLRPTTISKVNTVFQVAVLWASLVAPIFNFTDSVALKALYMATGFTTVWSGLSYVFDKSTVQILKDK